jgi:hypothetical protein
LNCNNCEQVVNFAQISRSFVSIQGGDADPVESEILVSDSGFNEAASKSVRIKYRTLKALNAGGLPGLMNAEISSTTRIFGLTLIPRQDL